MIRVHNKIIKQRQTTRKETKEKSIPEYETGN